MLRSGSGLLPDQACGARFRRCVERYDKQGLRNVLAGLGRLWLTQQSRFECRQIQPSVEVYKMSSALGQAVSLAPEHKNGISPVWITGKGGFTEGEVRQISA